MTFERKAANKSNVITLMLVVFVLFAFSGCGNGRIAEPELSDEAVTNVTETQAQGVYAQNALHLVRPNLGQPMLLTPGQLHQELTFTVAGMTYPPPTQNALRIELKNHVFILQKDGVGYYYYGLSGWPDPPKAYAKSTSQHPQSSDELRYKAGFRWEAKFRIRLNYQPIAPKSWPMMFDLHHNRPGETLGVNYHAVYVDPKLENPNEFTIIQATDPHIAGRNDRIPEVLAETRTEGEARELNIRYVNYNNGFREIISYANENVRNGKLTFIVATGDLVDYYLDRIPKQIDKECSSITPDPNKDNFQILRDLITGRDGKGEALRCPIFMVLGNHDFLKPEVPLTFDVNVGPLEIHEKNRFSAYGLKKHEACEYNYWSQGANFFKAFPNVSSCMDGRMLLKSKFMGYNIQLNTDEAYNLTNPVYSHLKSYLVELAYDPDYQFSIGPHQFLCLNTGGDIIPPKGSILWDVIFGGDSSELYVGDPYADLYFHGTHNHGITDEHLSLLDQTLNKSNSDSIIFAFTHAPFFGLPFHKNWKDYWVQNVLYEDPHYAHPAVPPNNIATCFLYHLLINEPMPSIPHPLCPTVRPEKWKGFLQYGFPQSGTRYFFGKMDLNQIDFRRQFDFSGTEGKVDRFFDKIFTSTYPRRPKHPLLALSGHTHKVHEFRMSWNDTHGFCLHIDDYSDSNEYYVGTSTIVDSSSQIVKRDWLEWAAPLFMTSGTTRYSMPKFRQIEVKGNAIESLKLLPLPQISNIKMNPASPAELVVNNSVKISFNYSIKKSYDGDTKVKIHFTPYTNGSPSPNSDTWGTISYQKGKGEGSCHFTIRSGYVLVDELLVEMTTSDGKEVLLRKHIKVNYKFKETPPIADFSANKTEIFVRESVSFTDLSSNEPTSWVWSFPGGSPSSSTKQNPVVTYSTHGTYDVTLKVSNVFGTDTKKKIGYITVSAEEVFVTLRISSTTTYYCNWYATASKGTPPYTFYWKTDTTTNWRKGGSTLTSPIGSTVYVKAQDSRGIWSKPMSSICRGAGPPPRR